MLVVTGYFTMYALLVLPNKDILFGRTRLDLSQWPDIPHPHGRQCKTAMFSIENNSCIRYLETSQISATTLLLVAGMGVR